MSFPISSIALRLRISAGVPEKYGSPGIVSAPGGRARARASVTLQFSICRFVDPSWYICTVIAKSRDAHGDPDHDNDDDGDGTSTGRGREVHLLA